MLLHNDSGGPETAGNAVIARFSADLRGVRTALDDLAANFATAGTQGPQAYVSQMVVDHPELDRATLAADAVVAVDQFCRILQGV